MSTSNRLDLQTLGSQPVIPKNLPDRCIGCVFNFRDVFFFAFTFVISVLSAPQSLPSYTQPLNLVLGFHAMSACQGSAFHFLLGSFDFGHNFAFNEAGMQVSCLGHGLHVHHRILMTRASCISQTNHVC